MHIPGEFNASRWDLDEATETILAIRKGAVDAFVVEDMEGHHVYTLEGADLPYSVLVERMLQGAAMVNARGEIIYCNASLADLLAMPRTSVIGTPLKDLVHADDQRDCQELVQQAQLAPAEREMCLRRTDGTLISANFSFQILSRDKSTVGVLVTDLTAQKSHANLTVRLQRLQDEERRRIARELHDSVGQLLAAIAMNTERLKQESRSLTQEAARALQDNSVMVDQVSKEIRTISHLLHPPLLDMAGLASAIRWYVDGFSERSQIKVDLEISEGFPRLRSDIEIALFRMVQECLANILRHSGSKSCALELALRGNELRLQVRDWGRGIPELKQAGLPESAGVGLRGMYERMQQLGGTLKLHSDESGTTVVATLPVSEADLHA